MTTYTLRSASPAKTRADVVVIGLVQGDDRPAVAPGGEDVAKAWGRKLSPMLASLGVTGKAGEVTRIPTAGTLSSPVLLLVGLGTEVSTTALRAAAGSAARAATNAASLALALPATSPAEVRAVTEGYLLGAYAFTSYKGTGKDGKDTTSDDRPADVVVLTADARKKPTVAAFEEARVVAAAVATARDWVNTPPGDLRPPAFARAVETAGSDFVKEHAHGRGTPKVGVTVWDEEQLAAQGFGGLISVGRGSSEPPRLVELSYVPKGATTHLALVGKGITFDSGGLSIKPAQGMHEMKSDMAGAAAVVAATLAVAALRLPVRVTAYAAMAENMLGSDATRPGDVVTIYGGRTVEVLNTDAEGRMVLADALVKAGEGEPDLVVDVATLTGAMVVALGDRVAGVMGDDEVVARMRAAAVAAGEESWPMPIPEEMHERVRTSKVADLAQVDWVRWGGGLYAAAFLREFVAGRPWAHLDIAGPAFGSSAHGHVTAGGTGYGVSTLVELVRGLADQA
ncbi:putative cytosol aminopeptidase [Nocardioides aquaticus]|uniref:Probable cytosol aminopeptidase n=1 Tax=Nocardioides aquaticus TaxID=160826 RepID=A0ABX8EKG6_9ACTN|nr:leucyl aminopeptidase [Nocardioides aquaticus]QVT80572.1 putative cytosol aminopeptidase [Nocardioides aquaticus]